jgi:hypothetical protein
VDRFEFAALDPVQHRLAGDAEGFGGLIEADPAVWDFGDDPAANLVGDADVPRIQVAIVGASVQLSVDGKVVRVHPIRHDRLLAELAGGHADRSFEARIRRLTKPAVLVVDDFAMREFTATQGDDLYELLRARVGHPGRSPLLTSNPSPADWYPLFPNAVVGESILDRVINSSHHLLLEGKSYRPTRRPGRTPATGRG